MVAHDGSRLDGEDPVSPAPGARIKGTETDYALRFHLHPAVKASRLSDARGVMLVLPNRDVWTFEAQDDRVDLEDSVFLAGNDGPRRTAQIVIRQDSRHTASVRWSFVRATGARGVELVTPGDTAQPIPTAGLRVRDVSELTGFPEMMDGRVKTLHPNVHGGLLAVRNNSEHAKAMKAHGIDPIDLLVVNLYPFEATVDKGAGFTECVANIDLVGP